MGLALEFRGTRWYQRCVSTRPLNICEHPVRALSSLAKVNYVKEKHLPFGAWKDGVKSHNAQASSLTFRLPASAPPDVCAIRLPGDCGGRLKLVSGGAAHLRLGQCRAPLVAFRLVGAGVPRFAGS